MQFQLKPFMRYPGSDYKIGGEIVRDGNTLVVEYTAEGNIPTIVLPQANSQEGAKRMGGLWETTCFEMFMKNDTSGNYLEFNFAPSGNWNCFSFDQYRQGMQEYQGLANLDIKVQGNEHKLILKASVSMKKSTMFSEIYFKEKLIKVGLSCVVENIMNVKSYWALCHPEAKPDFHSDDSFILRP